VISGGSVSNFVYELVSIQGLEVALWLHAAADPDNSDWNQACAEIDAHVQKQGYLNHRAIVVSDGGAPNAAQRKKLFSDSYKNHPLKMSVFTYALSSPFKRGIATAIMWLNPALSFQTPEEIGRGLEHIDLPRHGELILQRFAGLQKKMPPVMALSALARAQERVGAGARV
jgi:hypothetical protein